jgi:hypothetical protein
MTVYTSYYAGIIKGEAVSISLYPPKGWKGKHLPLFAPTPELLRWWKSSDKDAAAQQEYKRQFHEILQSRQQLIDLWVRKQRESSADITLCCFEKTGDFCHRHQVGQEIVQTHLPGLWGGEVGCNLHNNCNPDSASVNPHSVFKTENSQKDANQVRTPEANDYSHRLPELSSDHLQPLPSNISTNCQPCVTNIFVTKIEPVTRAKNLQNPSYPPVIVKLLSSCHESSYPVQCERLECGYYQVSLGDEDLGVWSELGLLGVLSGLRQEFYRGRLMGAVSG